MKTITIQYRAGATNDLGDDVGGKVEEWGTNSRNGGGCFSLRADGTWQQHVGNCDTPPFRSPAAFRDYLRKTFEVRNARITEQSGW